MHARRLNGLQIIMISLFVAAISILSVSCMKHAEKGIVPLDTTFNYPPPPSEGERNYFPIAGNGQARCVVVEPTNAPPAIHQAAEALRAYLQRVTGAPIRLIPENTPETNNLARINVGETAAGKNVPLDLPDVCYGKDKFPNLNGYLVKTIDQRTLVIRGLTEKGVAHGVVGFLKRYAGVRQYWECAPGGLGEVVPSRPTIFIPQVEWRDWPYFFSRSLSQRPFTPSRGQLDFFRRNGTLPCNENYSVLLPPKLYAKEHPEYFALSGGKRLQPADDQDSGWQPCLSNPDVARIMAEAVCDYFRKNTNAVALNVSINDGGRDCDCEACRAMDAPNADYSRRMSDRYIKFTNKICKQVEKEFPAKHIVFLAYGAASRAPGTVKPHPMILPVITVGGRNAMQAWDEWMQVGPAHMGFYLHHDDTLFFILPKLDLHQQARRIRHAVSTGRAMVVYMESYPHWPLSGLVSYITAELLWDPRQDVDALLDEFYTSFFGPAAAPMKTFYETVSAGYERWLEKNGLPYPAGRDISSIADSRSFKQFNVLTLDEARKASDALREAAKLSSDDPLAAKRIEAVERLFAIVAPCVETYWTAEQTGQGKVNSEEDARKNIERARRMFALSRGMAKHIATVLDNTPPDLNGAVFSAPGNKRPIELYEALKTGKPGPETIAAIRTGSDAVGDWLRKSRAREDAVRWWDDVIAAESEPDLAAIFKMARLNSGAGELKPLYRSDFDAAGRALAPKDLDIQAGDQEIVIDRFMESGRKTSALGGGVLTNAGFGVYAWHPDRTPFTLALTRKDTPGNVFVLMAQGLNRARLGAHAGVTSGARQFRVGFLFKHNSEPGRYTAEIVCNVGKRPDRKQVTVATLPIPEEPNVWHEVAASVETPEQVSTMFVQILVNNQSAGAKCWAGNVFISEYVK